MQLQHDAVLAAASTAVTSTLLLSAPDTVLISARAAHIDEFCRRAVACRSQERALPECGSSFLGQELGGRWKSHRSTRPYPPVASVLPSGLKQSDAVNACGATSVSRIRPV